MGLRSSIAVSYGVGHRCSWDPVLQWLWYRPAAITLIQPLACELPYAVGVVLKSKEKKKMPPSNVLGISVKMFLLLTLKSFAQVYKRLDFSDIFREIST